MMDVAADGVLVSLVVRDAKTCLDFYQNILGLKLVFSESMDDGGDKHYLKFNGGFLRLLAPKTPPETSPLVGESHSGYNLVTFMVKNIEAMYAVFDTNDVRIVAPLQSTDSGVRYGGDYAAWIARVTPPDLE